MLHELAVDGGRELLRDHGAVNAVADDRDHDAVALPAEKRLRLMEPARGAHGAAGDSGVEFAAIDLLGEEIDCPEAVGRCGLVALAEFVRTAMASADA